jgi:hypothetical protein
MNRLVKTGVAIAAAGTVPLLLYVVFGPKDGNPIGLGLLMSLAWFVGFVFIIAGLVTSGKSRGPTP